jgi:hypothetical protein
MMNKSKEVKTSGTSGQSHLKQVILSQKLPEAVTSDFCKVKV